MSDTFLSISNPSAGEYKDKGSKFLSFAYPIEDEIKVKSILSQLKQKYWDATHHCYAYVFGIKGEVYKANDDGEPNHSAGDPILSQIKSLKLTNVLVVVVRYYGGTKLGVSGLITAYKSAAKEALQNSEIVEKVVTVDLEIKFGVDDMSIVMKAIKGLNGEVLEQGFLSDTLQNVMVVRLRASSKKQLEEVLRGAWNVQIAVVF